MLKRTYLDLSGRVLPLRSEQFSLQGPQALALRGQIWFTPEVIIWDGLRVVFNLLLVWRLFCRLVDRFALRVLIIAGLIFLVAGFSDSANLIAAGASGVVTEPAGKSATPAITTRIVAEQSPVFAWPVKKTYISTYFSSHHLGIDLPEPYGTPVKPLAAGVVSFAGWDKYGFGNTVIIQHPAGYLSRYSHLSKITVSAGQKINDGDTIGLIGATGVATGPHLHFEIHRNGAPVNPLTILP